MRLENAEPDNAEPFGLTDEQADTDPSYRAHPRLYQFETSGMIAAAEVLILIGENGGDPMFAHIATIRALRPREPKAAPALRRKRAKRYKIIV
jgi:hypothetical protein